MQLKHSIATLGLILNFGHASISSAQVKAIEAPKLVVVLVIDQFRADTIKRFESKFLPARDSKGNPGGFKFLMEEGAYYPLAEYGQLQNMTCPGHATILSGAYSYRHGIAINQWIDRETGKYIYCVEDSNSPLVGASKEGRGVSPRNFVGTTLGDEMKNSGLQGRSVTIALKDRSAILLGGYRNDLAIWFDKGRWISSQFYAPENKLPAWVSQLNAKIEKEQDTPYVWNYQSSGTPRSLPDNKDIIPTVYTKKIGTSFPHEVAKTEVAALLTPYATQLTVDAAIAAIEGQNLGSSKDTDLLAVSLSAHDFLAHNYGPNSLEIESLTVDEDKGLARLFATLDKKIGLKNTVIVLTADHGGASNPDWLKSVKLDAGRLDEKDLVASAETYLSKQFGKPKSGKWIFGTQYYNFYLDYKNLRDMNLKLEQVQDELARFFREGEGKHPAIAEVFSSSEIEKGSRKTGPFLEKLIHQTYKNLRNGDVIVIPKPNYLPSSNTTDHVSGYAYDRYVPLFFYGKAFKKGTYSEAAGIIDIAPTLAFILGVTPPSGSEGRVLSESFVPANK